MGAEIERKNKKIYKNNVFILNNLKIYICRFIFLMIF